MASILYRGRCLLSIYIFPIYSPTIPKPIKTHPEQNHIESIKEDQPFTVIPVKYEYSIHANTQNAIKMKKTPSIIIRRMGLTENEVIPSIAKFSILDNGYLDSPAKRSARL